MNGEDLIGVCDEKGVDRSWDLDGGGRSKSASSFDTARNPKELMEEVGREGREEMKKKKIIEYIIRGNNVEQVKC